MADSIYQLKIALEGSKPPIWRRVLVADDTSLGDLHTIIQITMGWHNCHLHQFVHDRVLYGELNDDFEPMGMDMRDETETCLSELVKKEKDFLHYEYDFGDGWMHRVSIEKVLPLEAEKKLPRCLKGVKACPPEDCGGIWGYMEMLNVLEDENDPERDNILDWLGGDFDPAEFSLREVNGMLNEYCR